MMNYWKPYENIRKKKKMIATGSAQQLGALIGCRKVKTCWFGSAKWFWPGIFSTVCWGWGTAQRSLTLAVDWLDRLIGPGGLLLVVSHLFAVPVLVL